MNKSNFVKQLYTAVDKKDLELLSDFLSDEVFFRIANFDPVTGKEACLKANQNFFSSITSMRHQIDNVWEQGDDVICNGRVDYIRFDSSSHSVPFATIFKLKQDKIINYLVYADISKL